MLCAMKQLSDFSYYFMQDLYQTSSLLNLGKLFSFSAHMLVFLDASLGRVLRRGLSYYTPVYHCKLHGWKMRNNIKSLCHFILEFVCLDFLEDKLSSMRIAA